MNVLKDLLGAVQPDLGKINEEDEEAPKLEGDFDKEA